MKKTIFELFHGAGSVPDAAARRRYYGGRGERSRPSDDSRRHRTVALKISGGTVALENVELTSGYVGHNNKHNPALYITGGSLTVTGSTFTGKVVVFCENPNTHPTLSIKHQTCNPEQRNSLWGNGRPS